MHPDVNIQTQVKRTSSEQYRKRRIIKDAKTANAAAIELTSLSNLKKELKLVLFTIHHGYFCLKKTVGHTFVLKRTN